MHKIMIHNLKVLLTLPFYPPFFVVFLKVGKLYCSERAEFISERSYQTTNLVLRMACNTRHLSCNESRYDDSITICLVLLYYYFFIYERQNIHSYNYKISISWWFLINMLWLLQHIYLYIVYEILKIVIEIWLTIVYNHIWKDITVFQGGESILI